MRQPFKGRACAPISPCAAASTCPIISAATRRSRSASSAAMAGARCAPAMCCISVACRAASRRRLPCRPTLRPRTHQHVGDRRSLWSARRAGFLHGRRYRDVLLRRLGGSLQFEPHRRAPDRPEARLGAHRWRRSGAASLQHPRQRLCHRHHRFHRRHAGDPRARWSVARRLRVSGDDRAGRTVEDRTAEARRPRALRAPVARRSRAPRSRARCRGLCIAGARSPDAGSVAAIGCGRCRARDACRARGRRPR